MGRISGQVDKRQGKAHISPLRVRISVKLESTMETCTAYYNYTFRLIEYTSVVRIYVITGYQIRIGFLIYSWSML